MLLVRLILWESHLVGITVRRKNHLMVVFSFLGIQMRTIAYIDGYNFYYGLLKDTGYKWLDVAELLKKICNIQNPKYEIILSKYFTSPVLTRVATKGELSHQSQNTYHKALTITHGENIEIIMGYHSLEKGTPPIYEHPIQKDNKVEVWKLEEKQTDVNIALHMYRDAIKQSCDQIILVSSDSDLEPALKMIKEDVPEMEIGLILPRKKPTNKKNRPGNEKLSRLANWTRSYISEEELELFQLPEKVPTKKKPAIKPQYW